MPVRRITPYVEASDFAAVKAFYVSMFGLEAAMEDPDSDFLGLVAPGNRSAQIVVAAEGAEHPQPALGIDVGTPEAVSSAHEAALRDGLEVVYPLIDEAWGIRRFFVKDPTGTVVSVLAHI